MSDSPPPTAEPVAWRRYAWVAPLVVVAAVTANAVIRTISKAIFGVPDEFGPFMPANFVGLTVISTVSAVLVFGLVGWLSERPFHLYNRIAAVVLVLTWVPDSLLLVFRPYPGVSMASVGTLMLMHATAAAITVGLLNTQAKVK